MCLLRGDINSRSATGQPYFAYRYRHLHIYLFTHDLALAWPGVILFDLGSKAGVWRENCQICAGLDGLPTCGRLSCCNITCNIGGICKTGRAGSNRDVTSSMMAETPIQSDPTASLPVVVGLKLC
jgi:hypothetical protein